MNIEAQSQALRRLAAQLVRDRSQADDLAQDTWVDALVSPPAADRPRGPWLRTVLRNRRVTNVRAQIRRARREQASGAPRDTPSADQIQLARQLLEHLSALPERDRDVLTLRYWEALTLNECAERLGISASAVRSRHARALGRLRERLDMRTGGRDAWLSALAPWVTPAPAKATAPGPSLSLASLSVGGIVASSCLWLLSGLNPGCDVELGTNVPPDVIETPPPAAHKEPQDPSPSPVRPASESLTRGVDFDDDKHPCELPIAPKDAPSVAEALASGERLTSQQSLTAWRECIKQHGPSSDYGVKDTNSDGSIHPLLSAAMSMRQVWPTMRHCYTGSEPARARLSFSFWLHADGSMTIGDIKTVRHEGLTPDERACIESSLYVAEIDLRRGDATQMELPSGTEIEMPRLVEVELQNSTTNVVGGGYRPQARLALADKDGFDDRLQSCDSESIGATLRWDPVTGELLEVEPDESLDADTGACLTRLLESELLPQKGEFFPRTDADTLQHCMFSPGQRACEHEPMYRVVVR